MTILFVETSALLRVLFQEPGFDLTLKKLESADRLIASRLMKVEADRAVIRAAKMQGQKREAFLMTLEAHLRAIWTKFDCIEMTREICDLAGRIAPEAGLRALDAIHAATYRWLHSNVSEVELLSYDQRLLDAISLPDR